jgi:hypothetical protein
MIIATNLVRWQLVHGDPRLQIQEHGIALFSCLYQGTFSSILLFDIGFGHGLFFCKKRGIRRTWKHGL